LDALCLAFLASCAVYLAVYVLKGDSYQLWKFAGMTALPLSFLPPTLLFVCLARLAGRRPALLLASGIAAWASLVLAAQLAVPAAGGPREALWKTRPPSLLPLAGEVARVGREAARLDTLVFDLSYPPMNLAAIMLSGNTGAKRLLTVEGRYFIPDHADFFPLIREGTAFYTDRGRVGPYGASFARPGAAFRIERWDPEDFRREGAVAWLGADRFSGGLLRPESIVLALPPAKLKGRDAILAVRLRAGPEAGAAPPRCLMVQAAVLPSEEEPPEADLRDLKVRLPAGSFAGGPAAVLLLFPEAARKGSVERTVVRGAGLPDGRAGGGDAAGAPCDYVFEKAEILPADGPEEPFEGDGA
jgi:hypothetical protein